MDSLTHKPIEAVEIISKDNNIGTVSDENGYYEITLPAGEYHFIIQITGYQSISDSIIVRQGRSIDKNYSLTPATYPAKPVIITGKRMTEGLFNFTITKEMLQIMPVLAEADPLRAIHAAPGITAASDYSTALFVRGSSADQTMITFDDVTVYNPYHLGGIFSMFNPDGVEEVEFQPGIYSAEYGGRLAGRLNIVPTTGKSDNYNIRASVGTLSSRIALNGSLGRGSLFFAGRRTYIDVIEQFFTGELGGYHFYDFQGGITYPLTPKHLISIQGFFSKDALNDVLEPNEKNLDNLKQPGWGNRILTMGWKHQFNDHSMLSTRAAFSDAFVKSNTLHINVNNLIRDVSLKTKLVLIRGNHHFQTGIEAAHLSYTYNWNIRDARNLSDIVNPPQKVFFDHAPAYYQYHQTGWQGNVFFQDDFKLSPKLSLLAGLRSDWHDLSNNVNFQPRFWMSYKFNENIRGDITYARNVQHTYTLKEIQNEDLFAPFSVYFPILAPEQPLENHYFASGVGISLADKTDLKFEFYYKRLRNIPGYNNLKREIMLQEGRAAGLDFLLHKTVNRFFVAAGYSLGFSQLKDDGKWHFASYDRRHHIKILGGLRLSKGWQIGFYWTYLSGLPYTPIAGKFVGAGSNLHNGGGWYIDRPRDIQSSGWGKIPGEKNSLRYPAYHRLDIGISKEWRHFSLKFQVFNIYNRSNPLFYGWNLEYAPPAKDNKDNFPVIPALEISAHF